MNLKKLLTATLLASIIIFPGCRKTPPESPKDYTGITLTYYKMHDDASVIQPFITDYKRDKQGLNIIYKEFDDFKTYQQTIINELAEGKGPDIFSMPNHWFTSNIGKITPLPESFSSAENTAAQDFQELFVQVASNDLVHIDEDGQEKVFGIPMTVDTLALYYNKDHFEDRLPSQGKPSNTWAGIAEDVQALTKPDSSFSRFEVSGIALGQSQNISNAVDILYLMMLQHGTQIYNQNISSSTISNSQGSASNIPAEKALELFLSFSDPQQRNYSWNQFTATPEEKDITAFAKGELSMLIGYSFDYQNILDQIQELKKQGLPTINQNTIRIAEIPQITDPNFSNEKRITYANYFAETVSRNSEHPEIAWDFLVEITQKDKLQEYFEATNKPTSRRDMIQEQKIHPIYGIFASQIGYSESFPILDYYQYKEIFSQLIDQTSTLQQTQNSLNAQLPPTGLINEAKPLESKED